MKAILKIVLLLSLFASIQLRSQNFMLDAAPEAADLYIPGKYPDINPDQNLNAKTLGLMSCPAASTLVTGYPAWANYWAGWMVNINNISTNTITINCFEARFQGTSGYRIYYKTGTFVGFETNAAAWTLVGTAANVTSASTTTSSAIPITVNVNINPGTTMAFYLTRTDNVIANRHLYVAGAGTPGTTVYASNADLQVTEANYIDTYFINMGGTRRPSFQAYYTYYTPLAIELSSFECNENAGNVDVKWSTSREINSNYFLIERSTDAITYEEIAKLDAAGNSNQTLNYSFTDKFPHPGNNYYRLKQVDINGAEKTFKTSVCEITPEEQKLNIYSISGQLIMSVTSFDYLKTMNSLELNAGIYLIERIKGSTRNYVKYLKQ